MMGIFVEQDGLAKIPQRRIGGDPAGAGEIEAGDVIGYRAEGPRLLHAADQENIEPRCAFDFVDATRQHPQQRRIILEQRGALAQQGFGLFAMDAKMRGFGNTPGGVRRCCQNQGSNAQ